MDVAVILKTDPFSWKAIQAFKIASALSWKFKVAFITIKEGVYFLTDWSPKELGYEDFKTYKVNGDNLIFVVDRDDFEVRGLDKSRLWVKDFQLEFAEEKSIAQILQNSKLVGVW